MVLLGNLNLCLSIGFWRNPDEGQQLHEIIYKHQEGQTQLRQKFPPFLKIFLFYFYLILAALGLRCCVRAFSSCCEQGLLFVVVHGLLIAVASLVAEHRL